MAPTGRYLKETFAQLGQVDVEHHHDEQEQHGHRTDIDDDQDHGDELGADQQEQRRGVEERQDQEQHRIDGIARHHDMAADAMTTNAKHKRPEPAAA